MKSYNNLFGRITSFENLLLAARKAQRGKRFKAATAIFNLNLEKELLRLQEKLVNDTYHHGGYYDFLIYDPKQRLISAAPYRDRVVHHALCNVIEPLLDKSFIFDTYACRKNKGTHAAVDRYQAFARKNRYVLKCDIRKYFASIDHEILLAMIARKIRCLKTQGLIRKIVGSRLDPSQTTYFPGDDLFTPITRKKGIPIGNLTSQFFANLYLDGFDHFIKETLGCRHYIRYVDDWVVLDNSKERLNDIKAQAIQYLEGLRLALHPKKNRVHRVCDGILFLGYRIFPSHRLLAKSNVLGMRRRLKKMELLYRDGKISLASVHQRIQSWIGHAGHADTWRLRQTLLAGVVFSRGTT